MATDPKPDVPPTLIYGAGAVGSFVGGLLASTGVPVTLLGRSSLATAVAARGLRIDGADRGVCVRIPAITALEQLREPPAIVVLATKAYAVEAALPDLRRLVSDGAAIVTLQNGAGVEETVLAALPGARLAAGSVTVSVSAGGPGRASQESAGGGLALAPVREEVPIRALAAALSSAGLPTAIMRDYRAMKWSKLLLNILGNATSAILAWPPSRIYADARLFEIERAAFLEALAVMRASGVRPVSLPGFNVPLLARVMRLPAPLSRRLIARRVAGGRGDKRPSLWIDVESGRKTTEVRWLNGAIAAEGERRGVATPVNARLTQIVEAIACDPARRRDFAGHPDALREALLMR